MVRGLILAALVQLGNTQETAGATELEVIVVGESSVVLSGLGIYFSWGEFLQLVLYVAVAFVALACGRRLWPRGPLVTPAVTAAQTFPQVFSLNEEAQTEESGDMVGPIRDQLRNAMMQQVEQQRQTHELRRRAPRRS